MDSIEKYLESQFQKNWTNVKYATEYGRYPQEVEELVWRAEYYRDGLAQYRMLHNPVLTYIMPRLSLLTGLDLNKPKFIGEI